MTKTEFEKILSVAEDTLGFGCVQEISMNSIIAPLYKSVKKTTNGCETDEIYCTVILN